MKNFVVTTSVDEDFQNIVIEAKHFSVASTLSRVDPVTLCLPKKIGEPISQLYVVACARFMDFLKLAHLTQSMAPPSFKAMGRGCGHGRYKLYYGHASWY